MARLNKSIVEAALPRDKDYIIWDSDLIGFGLRVFVSGRRSYVIQYRVAGRSRRYTIGLHGIWTAETARQQAKIELGRIAQGGGDPAEEKQLSHRALTVRQLCERYLADMEAGLLLVKSGRPKRASTVKTDLGRIHRHIIPLIGTRRVKDLTKADVIRFMRDVMAGRTRTSVKTGKLRGRAIVRGGSGAAARTVGLLGGILAYAIDMGEIDQNPAHGIRKPKYNSRERRLSEAEYRIMGDVLRGLPDEGSYAMTADIIRQLAMTGCRRSEIINLKWSEVDIEGSCLRLEDSKTGASVRPVGLPVIEYLEQRCGGVTDSHVFPGREVDTPFGGFPRRWDQIFKNTPLADVTPHILRHSFASIANDLGFTEVTIAGLIGHAKGSVTSRYIHTLDSLLISAADTVAGYIHCLLNGIEFKQKAHAIDRCARKAMLSEFLNEAAGKGGVLRVVK